MQKLNSSNSDTFHPALDSQSMEELQEEIEKARTIDQCLTLARLYLKRAKELSHNKPGVLES